MYVIHAHAFFFAKRRWLEKSFAAVEARRQPLPTSWHGAPSPLTVHVTLLAPSMPRILTNVGTFSLTNRGIVCVRVCCVTALGRGGSGRPAAHNTWFAVFRWPTSHTSLGFGGGGGAAHTLSHRFGYLGKGICLWIHGG